MQTTKRSQELTVAEYLAAVASASPTPGGGSVAATVAALAASLAEMVCGITLAGKKPPADSDSLESARSAAGELRLLLLDLASKDEAAYAGYRAAAALPKSNEVEIAARRDALQSALIHSSEVPIEIAVAALRVLNQLAVAGQFGTKHALSDIATGAYLAEAAIHSSLLNVEVNAGSMLNRALAAAYLDRSAEIAVQARDSAARVRARVDERR